MTKKVTYYLNYKNPGWRCFIQNIPANILFEIDMEYFCKDII